MGCCNLTLVGGWIAVALRFCDCRFGCVILVVCFIVVWLGLRHVGGGLCLLCWG